MPGPEFFVNLGLFVASDFFEPGVCDQVCAEMRGAASEQGGIVLSSGEHGINESVRRVMCAKVGGPKERFVRERLESLRPRLEQHFNVLLAASPRPDFLIYGQGAFYTAHTDTGRDPKRR